MNYSYISHSSFPLKKSDLISQNLEVISGILQENRLWKYVQINSLSRLDKLDSLLTHNGLSRNRVFLPFSVMLASNICIPTQLRLSIQNGHSSNNYETSTEDDPDSEAEDLSLTETIKAILFDMNGSSISTEFLPNAIRKWGIVFNSTFCLLFLKKVEVFSHGSERDSLKVLLGSEHILDARPISGNTLTEKHRLGLKQELRSVLDSSASAWCSSIEQWSAECAALSSPPDDAADADPDADEDAGEERAAAPMSAAASFALSVSGSPVVAAARGALASTAAGRTPGSVAQHTSLASASPNTSRPQISTASQQQLLRAPHASLAASAASTSQSQSANRPLQTRPKFPPFARSPTPSLSSLATQCHTSATTPTQSSLRYPTQTRASGSGVSLSTSCTQTHPSPLAASSSSSSAVSKSRFPTPNWSSVSRDGCSSSVRPVQHVAPVPLSAAESCHSAAPSPPAARTALGPPPAKRASLSFLPLKAASPPASSVPSASSRRSEPLSRSSLEVASARDTALDFSPADEPLRLASAVARQTDAEEATSIDCMNEEQLDALIASIDVPDDFL